MAVIARKTKTQAQLRKEFEKATKLSQVLRMALHDLAKAERSKKYEVNMFAWYLPQYNDTCSVCLAGSVMAGRYRALSNKLVSSKWQVSPGDFDEIDDCKAKFLALNEVRSGCVKAALRFMRQDVSKWTCDIGVTPYEYGRSDWWGDMKQIYRALCKAGL